MSTCYLGIDLHKRRSYVVLMDSTGKMRDEGGITDDAMGEYLKKGVPFDTTAVTNRAELGEAERFSSADRAARWAGLTPKVHVSDETVQHGPISRQGSPYLREAMVGAALRAIRYSPRLRSFYQRISKRRGSGMARVALGRKMLIIAWTMLMRGEPYREDYR
jgi:hypothetical protein